MALSVAAKQATVEYAGRSRYRHYAIHCACGCGWAEKDSFKKDVVTKVQDWHEHEGRLFHTQHCVDKWDAHEK